MEAPNQQQLQEVEMTALGKPSAEMPDLAEAMHEMAPPQMASPEQMEMGGNAQLFGENIQIQQNPFRGFLEMLTAMIGCDLNNKYNLTQGAGGRSMFLKEDSNCLCRYYLQNHRAFKVNLFDSPNDTSGKLLYTGDKASVTFHDVCPCACIAACRPEMRVTNANGDKIGWIRDPFACCAITEEIKDAQGDTLYTFKAGICQPTLLCPCLQICMDTRFDMVDVKSGSNDGYYKKLAGGLYQCLCGDLATKFEMQMPSSANTDDKRALMVMTAMMIDMIYFEKA